MSATDSLRRLGAGLLIRATSGICDRSRLNAELAGALAEARSADWAAVNALYGPSDLRLTG